MNKYPMFLHLIFTLPDIGMNEVQLVVRWAGIGQLDHHGGAPGATGDAVPCLDQRNLVRVHRMMCFWASAAFKDRPDKKSMGSGRLKIPQCLKFQTV